MNKNRRTRRTRIILKRIRMLFLLTLLITITIILVKTIRQEPVVVAKDFSSVNVLDEVKKKEEIVDVIYEEDILWMAMIGQTEIGVEYNTSTREWKESSDEAVLWVMASIFNRVNSDIYPNTVKDVVTQGNGRQYNGYRSKDFGIVTERMKTLARKVISGEFKIDENIMWYFNPSYSTDTKFVNSMMQYKVYEIGGHVFCNNDGR